MVGVIQLAKIGIIVQVYFLEIIFTTGINLDFITTMINSFNRNQNIRNISRLVVVMSLYSFLVQIGLLVYFFTNVSKDNLEAS